MSEIQKLRTERDDARAEIVRLKREVEFGRNFSQRDYSKVNQVLDDLMGSDWKGGKGGLASDVHEAITQTRAELAGVVAAVEALADQWSDFQFSADISRDIAVKRIRAALSSTGAGEALALRDARVREQAWDEGFGRGFYATSPEPLENPYAGAEKECGDE